MKFRFNIVCLFFLYKLVNYMAVKNATNFWYESLFFNVNYTYKNNVYFLYSHWENRWNNY